MDRRVFKRLPEYLKTEQNNRSTYISDDVLFEPEQAEFVNGIIGDISNIPDSDLQRRPPIKGRDTSHEKYQLTLGAVTVDPSSDARTGGAFYTDLIGQLEANGAILSEPNRLFSTPFYAWTPPIDYDRHINYSRYYWTGAGDAQMNGEYITIEPRGSRTVLLERTATGFRKIEVTISETAPTGPDVEIWEDVSEGNRPFKRKINDEWAVFQVWPETDMPNADDYALGEFAYVQRTGHEWQRPIMRRYSAEAGRWISQVVVVGPMPDTPVDGMIWEDCTVIGSRPLRVYSNGGFTNLVWGKDADYQIDTTTIESHNGWSRTNWWRHFDDLSPVDRAVLSDTDQAVRPIIEFWSGLELTSTYSVRNTEPLFCTYVVGDDGELVKDGRSSTIFQYKRGTGRDDFVLGFQTSHSRTGELQFELTLEDDADRGYRYMRDVTTDLFHSIWAKSETETIQEIDENGLASLPAGMTSNPNHEVLTTASRSNYLLHMTGVIGAQSGFSGNAYSANSYRWSGRNPTVGATIIDCEHTLHKALAALQRPSLDIPLVTRRMAREYAKVLSRFQTRMNILWDGLRINEPTGDLKISPSDAVNIILTDIMIGKGPDFPFFHAGMGSYMETQITASGPRVVGIAPKPIHIPPSPARINAAHAYHPALVQGTNGMKLRGHDGTMITSFGDDRDLIWLELQNRFFNEVPTYFHRSTAGNFRLEKTYGRFVPNTTLPLVDVIVETASDITTPETGKLYAIRDVAAIAAYNGVTMRMSQMQEEAVFRLRGTNDFYLYNGQSLNRITTYDRTGETDYSVQEYRRIMRREFERWVTARGLDFVANTTFNPDDKFTWNYRSAGVEGNYRAIYRRVYGTATPQSTPWEILGVTVMPQDWLSRFEPDATAADGSPRYGRNHAMWVELFQQAGVTAPIPVDAAGELVDPVSSGMIDQETLVFSSLGDDWMYGDGADVEQQFIESTDFTFAQAICGYLMKPGRFVDSAWVEYNIDIGAGRTKIWGNPHVVRKDTKRRDGTITQKVHLEYGESHIGLNAWISEYVRILGNDVKAEFGDVMRNTEISLAWKTGGFINADRVEVRVMSSVKLPYEDVHTILHQSKPVQEKFASGVLVTRDGDGYRVFGYDMFNPRFEVDAPLLPQTGGQVEMSEHFTAAVGQRGFEVTKFSLPQNAKDSAIFSVLLNGIRLKAQFIAISGNTFVIDPVIRIMPGDRITATLLTAQSSTRYMLKQFVLDGVAFAYADAPSGQSEVIEYGRYFDHPTAVINFMLGYGRKLKADGWVFERGDDEGYTLDWMQGVKAFASWVVDNRGVDDPEDFYFTPFHSSAKLNSPFGQVMSVEALQNGVYGLVDRNANPIHPDRTDVSRVGPEVMVTSEEPMYGIRMMVVEYQHVVFFSNVTRFNDVIYDPVTALYQRSLMIDAYRTKSWTGRLEAPGFIISGGNLLPNLEKQAKDFTKFYDTVDVLDDPVKRDQARGLYGWTPLDTRRNADGLDVPLMSAIGADERSRFDYHLGMIHAKGTIRPVMAFARGTTEGYNTADIFEEWAWRESEFGDLRYSRVAFNINEDDCEDQTTVIIFPEPGEEVDQPGVVVPPFDRDDEDGSGPWVEPPAGDNETFPVDEHGNPLPDSGTVSVIIGSDPGTGMMYHLDPVNDRYDPEIISQIEFRDYFDPASYTDRGFRSKCHVGDYEIAPVGAQWGSEQRGTYWWDYSSLRFLDYHRADSDVSDWGRLHYYGISITADEDDQSIAIIRTFDGRTGELTAHSIEVGDRIKISGCNPDFVNGEYEVMSVLDEYEFEIQLPDYLTIPAAGAPRAQTGFVDVYEWVESTHRPSAIDPDGNVAPYKGDATDYVTEVRPDANGRAKDYYYFWAKTDTPSNPNKTMNVREIADRISNPVRSKKPWFGFTNPKTMLIHFGETRLEPKTRITITHDWRTMDSHHEWSLIGERDKFNPIPDTVIGKMIDSLVGRDKQGSEVPSHLLHMEEQYGTAEFPPQSVFRDRETALDTFVRSFNRIMTNIRLDGLEKLDVLFPLPDEGDWWERSDYLVDVENITVYDTVATSEVMMDRLGTGLYAVGDVICVITSDVVDSWEKKPTHAYFRITEDGPVIMGYGNNTVRLLKSGFTDAARTRLVIERVYDLLTPEYRNRLFFDLAYEMLHQSPNADWFIKTSYVAMHVYERVARRPFVTPSHVDAIMAAFQETKPYRTKLRASTYNYTLAENENMGVNLDDVAYQKITLTFDRLAFGADAENGWDTKGWDATGLGWDAALWALPELGTTTFREVARVGCDPTNLVYEFETINAPMLNKYRLRIFQGSNEVNLTDIGVTARTTTDATHIRVTLSSALPATYTMVIEESIAFVDGKVPSYYGETGDMFRVTPSDYQHYSIRLMTMGYSAPFPELVDASGNPHERVEGTMKDNIVVKMTTVWTEAYAGWDAMPFDVQAWDVASIGSGEIPVYLSLSQETELPPGLEYIQTSHERRLVAGEYEVVSSMPVDVEMVSVNGNPMVLGRDYEFYEGSSWAIRFLPLPDMTVITAGETAIDYGYSPNGVEEVFVDHVMLDAERYTVADGKVTFVQPDPTTVSYGAEVRIRAIEVQNVGRSFTMDIAPGATPESCLLFVDGKLDTDYVWSGNVVTFPEDVLIDTKIASYSVGFGEPMEFFTEAELVGDGVQTTFSLTSPEDLLTMIFIDGRLMNFGTDYSFMSNSVIFSDAPDVGAEIVIRQIDATSYVEAQIGVHRYMSMGEPVDTISEVGSLLSNEVLLFVDGYHVDLSMQGARASLVSDVNGVRSIVWNEPPVAGQIVTLRWTSGVIAKQEVVTLSYPPAGTTVRIKKHMVVKEDDVVVLFHNNFPFNDTIQSRVMYSPVPVEIDNGVLRLTELIDAGTVIIQYLEARRGPNRQAIFSGRYEVVDRVQDKLSDYDVAGFEDNRRLGLRVAVIEDSTIFEWDGSRWQMIHSITPDEAIHVATENRIVRIVSGAVVDVYRPELGGVMDGVVAYPWRGQGILSGTYAYGNAPNAAVAHPVAFELASYAA